MRFQPEHRRRRCTTLIAAAAMWCGAAHAQTLGEEATVRVHRDVPGQAKLEPARIASQMRVPPGFHVRVFASGLGAPRMMQVGPDGAVYVTRRDEGDVLVLRDTNGDGTADETRTFASGLPGVHGIDILGNTLYLASSTTIWSTPLAAAAPQVIVSGLPDGGQHPNRMLRFGPDGMMYVSIGSACNDCAEANQLERATIIRYTPDGKSREVVANGLRNTIGYDWHPSSGALWGMDHGADFHGDIVPPEELNQIKPGANYGWPICYGAQVVDKMTNAMPMEIALKPGQAEPSGTAMTREEYCAQTEGAALEYGAHAAPMALQFYRGTQFPAAYRGDAFIAFRGSWNRSEPTGYKIARIYFSAAGTPERIDAFMTGFLSSDKSLYFGRAVGITTMKDGSLLVSDDAAGLIYRIHYDGQGAGPAPR